MSFSCSRLVASVCLAFTAALYFSPSESLARDGRLPSGENVIGEIPALSRDASRDVIFEMAPMQPVKKIEPAVAAKPAPATPVVADKPKESAPTQAKAAPTPAEAAVAKDATTHEPPHMALVPPKPTPEAVPAAEKAAEVAAPVTQDKPAVAPAPVEAAKAEPAQAAEKAPAIAAQTRAESPADLRVGSPADAPAATGPEVAPKAAESAPQAADKMQEATAAPPVAANDNPAPVEETAPAAQAPSASVEPEQAKPEQLKPEQDQAELNKLDPQARIAALIAEGVKGPAEVRIADRATLWLPASRIYLSLEPARKLAEETGLDWRPSTQGLIVPVGDTLRWVAPVDVLDDGYIKPVENAALDAEKLLADFQAGLPAVNADRVRQGQKPVELTGWLAPPTLDAKHKLSACIGVAPQGAPDGADRFFNCEAWALGRQGAIKVSLAEGGEEAERLKGEALALADTIAYDKGKAYEDADPTTDPVAPYSPHDLLTSDVATRAPASTPGAAAEAASDRGPFAFVTDNLWHVLLLMLAAAFIAVRFVQSRKAQAVEQAAQPFGKRKMKPQVEPEDLPQGEVAAGWRRIAENVQARLGKKPAPDAGLVVVAESVERAAASADEVEAAVETVPASAATPSVESAIDAAESPVSALKKLAAMMRRSVEETPPPSVDVSRAVRAPHTLPGAAPFEAPVKEQARAAKIEEDLSLVEPGDAEATSAAISAQEALHEARA